MAHVLEAGRAYFQTNGRQIGMIAGAAILVIVVATFVMRSRAVAHEDAWRRKSQLVFEKEKPDVSRQSLESLLALSRQTSDPGFALSGLIDAAIQALRLAQQAPTPPDRELNEKARIALEELHSRFPDNPLAKGVALCGLATVEENSYVLDGDAEHKRRAQQYLQEVVDNKSLETMPFHLVARDRLAVLDKTLSHIRFDPTPPPPDFAPPTAPSAAGEVGKLQPMRPDEIPEVLLKDPRFSPVPIPPPGETKPATTSPPASDSEKEPAKSGDAAEKKEPEKAETPAGNAPSDPK